MKFKKIIVLSVILAALSACETEVFIPLEDEEPFLNVDAWLTHTTDTQVVNLTYTRPYFNNNPATGATGASVGVYDVEDDSLYLFTDANNEGKYIFVPQDSFGIIGHNYVLGIELDGNEYTAFSALNPVPSIDSITFEFNPEDAFIPEDYYLGEFFARDLEGLGNTYWVKTWKNGVLLDQPDEIALIYDAGFSAGAELDGLIFILPLRQFINRFEEDENDDNIPPFAIGDSVYVELHAITEEAWFFLSRVAEEINRPGGFGELFATPLADSPTNIIPSDDEVNAVGFFNISSISSMSEVVDDSSIRDNIED